VGFVHNDIKLANIIIDSSVVYLIDFGISSLYKFKNSEGKDEHIKEEFINAFNGNLLFGSRTACKGFATSRKHDVEQVFYLLCYLINGFSLPWKKALNMKRKELEDHLLERLKTSHLKSLLSSLNCKHNS